MGNNKVGFESNKKINILMYTYISVLVIVGVSRGAEVEISQSLNMSNELSNRSQWKPILQF